MSIGNIVETQTAPTKRRTSYGIVLKVGSFILNEWGLTEEQAKQVHAKLVERGDEPFTVGGITFSRRPASDLSAALAAFAAEPK